ncbi:hypothetical protein DAEQUDRAFT_766112 [Daedalea quercina L-15889]|uniref:Uncharacterized protein n=1 Tax=Daedalea quercina L-15889 TaxID=1314783 RepID=A0A165PWF2_9APHY|nr:hypothetical protein DAEQUDRAFT_766112 [Daedalea quercina L-15889]
MRTAAVVFVLFAFSGVASAAKGAGKFKKVVGAAKAGSKKIDVKKVSHHVGLLAGAAEKVGNAVSAFRSRRSYDDDLYARYYGDDLYARDFGEDMYARELEGDLYAREGDGAHWARDDLEDLFARAASEEGDYLVARGIVYDDLD